MRTGNHRSVTLRKQVLFLSRPQLVALRERAASTGITLAEYVRRVLDNVLENDRKVNSQ